MSELNNPEVIATNLQTKKRNAIIRASLGIIPGLTKSEINEIK